MDFNQRKDKLLDEDAAMALNSLLFLILGFLQSCCFGQFLFSKKTTLQQILHRKERVSCLLCLKSLIRPMKKWPPIPFLFILLAVAVIIFFPISHVDLVTVIMNPCMVCMILVYLGVGYIYKFSCQRDTQVCAQGLLR